MAGFDTIADDRYAMDIHDAAGLGDHLSVPADGAVDFDAAAGVGHDVAVVLERGIDAEDAAAGCAQNAAALAHRISVYDGCGVAGNVREVAGDGDAEELLVDIRVQRAVIDKAARDAAGPVNPMRP